MAKEIERKFKINRTLWEEEADTPTSSFIQQGYLSVDPHRVVRVRVRDNRATLTVKGIPEGITRNEFEYQIPLDEGMDLLELSASTILAKRRYIVEFEGHTWEVDEFYNENEGLLVAEIELKNEEESFLKPPWLGEEVTHDPTYSNLSLSIHPFAQWKNQQLEDSDV